MSRSNAVNLAAINAAAVLQHVSAGELAETRRMQKGRGAPVFWRLSARYSETIGAARREAEWMTIVRSLAILMSSGEPARRPKLHNRSRRLGEVLCDGGDPAWPKPGEGAVSPLFSERRLAQLLAAKGKQRADMLVRAARMLRARMIPGSGIDVTDIAASLLYPEDGRRIAKPYYARLDRVQRATAKSDHPKE